MSYYQKYRSEKVADLDLSAVRGAFETMMGSGKVAHAYLFVGPRGLGKTSAARILARLVNCEKNYTKNKLNKKLLEPCGECEACVSIKKGSAVDVMEIDAASHRGIDDIRDLRARVNLAPAACPKKVYIIDEVHMLTTEAFNALLKTLEEPPEHVMFILATTEAHKLPETIVSRCVRINFTKATTAELMTSLSRAVKGEGLKIDDEALMVLAEGLDGSFREGHKLLEQLANRYDPITAENVREVLRLVSNSRIEAILTAVDRGEADKVVSEMKAMEVEGVEVMSLVTKLLLVLQGRLRQGAESRDGWRPADVRLTRKLVKVVPRVKISPLPLLPLEMVLVEAALANGGGHVAERTSPASRHPLPRTGEGNLEKINRSEKIEAKVDFDQVVSGWPELLTRLQPRNHSVAGLLRSAKPKEVGDKFLTIEVFYKFHKDQLEQEARRRIIEEEVAKLWGPISVRCVLGERGPVRRQEAAVVPVGPEATGDEALAAAEEVFGV